MTLVNFLVIVFLVAIFHWINIVFIYSLDINDLINSMLMMILNVTAIAVKAEFIRRVNAYE